jgi:RNA polymerase sigma factor (sigma-70 family)
VDDRRSGAGTARQQDRRAKRRKPAQRLRRRDRTAPGDSADRIRHEVLGRFGHRNGHGGLVWNRCRWTGMAQQRCQSAPKYTESSQWHHRRVTAPEQPEEGAAEASPVSSTADLVAACRRGQAGAWGTLVRRYQRLIYAVPRRVGLDEGTAADVMQVVFERLVQHIDRIEDAARLQAWLVTTARRETLRVLALNRRLPVHASADADGNGDGDDGPDALAAVADPAPLHDDQLAAVQAQARLRAAVEALDPRSRALVELLFLHDPPLAYAEVAQRLGLPEGSIGPTRARCLAKLRKLLPDV